MRGFNALQLALGGVSAGIGGYQAAQAKRLEEERLFRAEQREIDRIKREEDRATRQEALLTRQEQRQALDAGMMPTDEYNRFIAADMPGATPRPAVRQTIGGQEFVYAPSAIKSQKHRMEILEGQKKLAGQQETRSNVAEALRQVESGGKRLSADQISSWSKLDRQERTSLVNNWIKANEPKTVRGGGGGGPSTKGMPSPEELQRTEGVWNSLTNVPDDQLSPEEVQFRNTMVKTFDKLRSSQRTAPAQSLIFQAVSAADAQNKRLTAPPKAPGGEETDYDRRRKAIVGGRGGQSAPAAPSAAGAKALEQEFPGQAAQIAEARRNGYSDQQIRQFLSGRR